MCENDCLLLRKLIETVHNTLNNYYCSYACGQGLEFSLVIIDNAIITQIRSQFAKSPVEVYMNYKCLPLFLTRINLANLVLSNNLGQSIKFASFRSEFLVSGTQWCKYAAGFKTKSDSKLRIINFNEKKNVQQLWFITAQNVEIRYCFRLYL